MKNKRLGSDFDDFLRAEKLLSKTEAAALKRGFAYPVQLAMKKRNISK